MFGTRQNLLRLLVIALLASTSCTAPASWQDEGTAGAACFPDGRCDPGLRCLEGRCQLPLVDTDAQVADGSLLDRQAPEPDLAGCAGQLSLPTLKQLPATTAQMSYPILGQALEAQEVHISGGAQDQVAPVRDGYFCAEVPLIANAVNDLVVVAVDAEGCLSRPAVASIRQQMPGKVNQLLGKSVWSSNAPKDGALLQLTDGMISSTVKFWFYDFTPFCDENITLTFDLEQLTRLDQVVVRYPDSTDFNHFLTCWALLASDEQDPLPPQRDTPGWRVLAESEEEEGGTLNIPLPGAVTRHLALLMYQDDTNGMWESFDLTEIEAWGGDPPGEPLRCP